MNCFDVVGDIVKIYLNTGQIAIVDLSDLESIKKYKWYAVPHKRGSFYVTRSGEKTDQTRTVYLHRQLMGYPTGMDIDHINHDSLDNRRLNLRVCTRSQNIQNMKTKVGRTSIYQGVHFHKGAQKWLAQIMINGKGKYLGLFINEHDAAMAYNQAAVELYGENARLNT